MPKPTLLDNRLAWFANHKLFSVLMLAAACVIAIASTTEALSKLWSVFGHNADPKKEPIRLVMNIANSTPHEKMLIPVTDFVIVESDVLRTHELMKGRVSIKTSTNEPQPFTLPSGSSRAYYADLPEIPLLRTIFERGGANLHIPIRTGDTHKIALVSAMFQKDAMSYYIDVDLKEAEDDEKQK